MDATLLSTEIRAEQDVVLARQRARQIAGLLGFDVPQQTRIATAVSELARNVFQYAGSGRVQFALAQRDNALVIRISDQGPGISNPQTILEGRYTSATGMGLGLLGARRLMDGFQLDTAPGKGTRIELRKELPRAAAAVSPKVVAKISEELAKSLPRTTALEEVQAQNQELLRALDELRDRQAEVERLEAERTDTASALALMQRTLFDATPDVPRSFSVESLFSVLRGWFGPQHPRERTWLQLDAPDALPVLFGDEGALGRALIEAVARAGSRANGGLRLQARFDAPDDLFCFELRSAEGELIQTVRVPRDVSRPQAEAVDSTGPRQARPERGSEALTEPQVDQQARPEEPSPRACRGAESPAPAGPVNDRRTVLVVTRDDAAFERYSEVFRPTALTAVRAFGPAAARDVLRAQHPVAVVLDGALRDEALWTFLSELSPRRQDGSLGVYAVGDERDRERVEPLLADDFTARPLRSEWLLPKLERLTPSAPSRKALIIDDDEVSRYVLKRTLSTEMSWAVSEAETGSEGLDRARLERPEVIFLDLRMPGMDGFEVLESLKSDPDTRDIPVIIHTSAPLSDSELARLTLDAAAILAKDSGRPALSGALRSAGLGTSKL